MTLYLKKKEKEKEKEYQLKFISIYSIYLGNMRYKQDEIILLLYTSFFLCISVSTGDRYFLFYTLYEADFLQGFIKNKDRKVVQASYSSFHYTDDVLSLNTFRFGHYLHPIYLNGLEVI